MLHIPTLDLLGTPFERGGRGPKVYDCYGLLIEMFARKGVVLPDFESPGTLEEIEALMDSQEHKWVRVPYGTLHTCVRFRADTYGSHVGFVLPGDKFIHTTEATGCVIERLTSDSFRPLGFYDYV